ncbi:TniQ family protein [Sinorhizobium meliloti]|uniref:TniQ family protein n=1 Tax=Rhizobium meliloti TaxID=382 RepID=UPI00299E5847|nr:hypothetical protein [Sinorhizobium meliloti]
MTERFEIVPPFREYETRDSFVSRLAALNQMVSVVDMARLLGESNDRSNIEPRFLRFAAMAGIDPSRFDRHSPKPGYGHAMLGDHKVHTTQVWKLQARYCPKCVVEDVEKGSGPIGARTFQRFWWLWTAIEKCPDHGCDMAVADDVKRSFAPDLCAFVSQNFPRILAIATAAQATCAHPLDVYLRGRLTGENEALELLDNLPPAYLIRLCEAVGRDAITKTGGSQTLEPAHMRVGFELLARGRARFLAHLESNARKFDKGRGLTRNAKYGRIYSLMTKEIADPVWAPIRELLWVDACNTLPLAPGEEFLGYHLEKRLVHSLHTASQQYGVHPKTIMKMLNSDVLSPEAVHRSSYHSTVFPADKIQELLNKVQSSASTSQVREKLGLTHQAITAFRRAGYLSTVDAGSAFGESRPRYVTKDVDAIVANLEACRVGRIRGAFRPFLTVFKWGRMRTADAYRLMLEGKIASVRKAGEARFDKLYIDYWDVLRELSINSVDGISLKETSKLLNVSILNVRSLIEYGFLVPGERIRKFGYNPVAYLKKEDVLEFKKKFGGMTGIANDLGVAVALVSRVIKAAKIEPLYPAARVQGKRAESRMFDRQKVVDAVTAFKAG